MSYRWFPRPATGRKPQNVRKVPFQAVWSMKLKNKVSLQGDRSGEVPCIKETLAFLTCLKDNDNTHAACVMQAQAVQKCYELHLKTTEELKKAKAAAGDFIPGKKATDMSPKELNRFLKHFPHKLPQK